MGLLSGSLFACNLTVDKTPTAIPQPPPSLSFAYEARADGSVRLTNPPTNTSDQNAAFAPDGSRSVFTRCNNDYNIGRAGLFLVDLASCQIIRLTPEEDHDNVNLPGSAWNAVHDRIVFDQPCVPVCR
jgi:Tol biopolymer transport system component